MPQIRWMLYDYPRFAHAAVVVFIFVQRLKAHRRCIHEGISYPNFFPASRTPSTILGCSVKQAVAHKPAVPPPTTRKSIFLLKKPSADFESADMCWKHITSFALSLSSVRSIMIVVTFYNALTYLTCSKVYLAIANRRPPCRSYKAIDFNYAISNLCALGSRHLRKQNSVVTYPFNPARFGNMVSYICCLRLKSEVCESVLNETTYSGADLMGLRAYSTAADIWVRDTNADKTET